MGKQRVEGLQLLNANLGLSKGWVKHPAAVMWKHNLWCLREYVIAICDEWVARGYVDTVKDKVLALTLEGDKSLPRWLNNCIIHSTHRAALLYKNYEHYKQFNWAEVPDIAYYWPI